MTTFVVDASVGVKWVVPEEGTREAHALLERGRLAVPELFQAECTNILWKKVRRSEMSRDEALGALELLAGSGVVVWPMRELVDGAFRLAVVLDHSVYDCLYLTLALSQDWTFVTADRRLLDKIERHRDHELRDSLRARCDFLFDLTAD